MSTEELQSSSVANRKYNNGLRGLDVFLASVKPFLYVIMNPG